MLITRKEFLKFLGLLATGGLIGCRADQFFGAPDIILDGSSRDADKIKKFYSQVEEMVKNPNRLVRIGLMDENGDIQVLDIFRRKDSSNISVFDEKNESSANLGFGMKGIFPSIKLMDKDGETLRTRDGEEMEYALFGPNLAPSRLAAMTATDWFMLGVKVAAVAFGIFLGAKILGLVLAAVAFLAYYCMILALVITGIALLSQGAKWFLGATGWNLDGIKDFFGKRTEEIRDLITEAAESF